MIGSETELSDEYPFEKLYIEILNEEGVSINDFKNHSKRYFK